VQRTLDAYSEMAEKLKSGYYKPAKMAVA
jgi:hypothetical protein